MAPPSDDSSSAALVRWRRVCIDANAPGGNAELATRTRAIA